MDPISLNDAGAVTLDGSGNGVLELRPDGSREYWSPTLIAVKVSAVNGAIVNEAQALVYIGPKIADQYLCDATYTGSSGNTTDKCTGHTVGRNADPKIIVQWIGGDAGATATARVTGTKVFR